MLVAELMELVVISTSEESVFVRDHLKSPAFTIMMRDILEGIVLPCDVKSANPTVVMSNENLVVHVVKR